MKILIDTQLFVWLIDNDPRLGQQAKEAIGNASNQVYLSYFSLFEMTIKASIGKVTIDFSMVEDLPKIGINVLSPDIDSLKNYEIINVDNRDPFDNILLSQAILNKLTFATADAKILSTCHPKLKLLDARR